MDIKTPAKILGRVKYHIDNVVHGNYSPLEALRGVRDDAMVALSGRRVAYITKEKQIFGDLDKTLDIIDKKVCEIDMISKNLEKHDGKESTSREAEVDAFVKSLSHAKLIELRDILKVATKDPDFGVQTILGYDNKKVWTRKQAMEPEDVRKIRQYQV